MISFQCFTRQFMVACNGIFVASADTSAEANAYVMLASSAAVDSCFGLEWKWCHRAEWLEIQGRSK